MTDRVDDSSDSDDASNERDEEASGPRVAALLDDLDDIEEHVDSPAAREQLQEAREAALDIEDPSVFGRVIRGYDRHDAAEAFVGAFLFGIPMFVEGGTQEVGEYVADHPLFLVFTLGLGLALTVGVLYVAEIQDVRVHQPLFGIVPRRLASVLAISLGMAALMMTVWGRVSWASDPWLAVCQVSVAFVPMALGASLGDILPGS